MQTEQVRYENSEITKQMLADSIQRLFTTNIQKQVKDILGEVSPFLPDPDKNPPQTMDESFQKISAESKALKHDITQAIQAVQMAIDTQQQQSTINNLYYRVSTAKQKYKTYHARVHDSQILRYVDSGSLIFNFTGPSLNDAWQFFQQTASKVRSRSVHLPAFIYFNKNHKTDPATWEPSDQPAQTASLASPSLEPVPVCVRSPL
jgi:hypothetical protein